MFSPSDMKQLKFILKEGKYSIEMRKWMNEFFNNPANKIIIKVDTKIADSHRDMIDAMAYNTQQIIKATGIPKKYHG